MSIHSLTFLYFLPFCHSSYSHVGHGRVSRTFQPQQSNAHAPPFLNFTHFSPDPHFRPDSPPVTGHQGRGADAPPRDPARLVTAHLLKNYSYMDKNLCAPHLCNQTPLACETPDFPGEDCRDSSQEKTPTREPRPDTEHPASDPRDAINERSIP